MRDERCRQGIDKDFLWMISSAQTAVADQSISGIKHVQYTIHTRKGKRNVRPRRFHFKSELECIAMHMYEI